jgi:uncharacterized coiled-coil protein SlyX
MSDYCLYPNQCGPGMDCSPCYQKRIAELESKLAAAESDIARHVAMTNEYMRDAEAERERVRVLREGMKQIQFRTQLSPTVDGLGGTVDFCGRIAAGALQATAQGEG